MEKAVSTDTIISGMRKAIEQRVPVSPEDWLGGVMKLTALLGVENDRYAELYQKAHEVQSDAIVAGETASQAEAKMKASDEYREMLAQKGRVEQTMEMIRAGKLMAQLMNKELPLSDV